MEESPLYVHTYQLLLWLIPQAQKYPRSHRFGLAERTQRLAFDFQDSLAEAGKARGSARLQALHRADVQLEQLRMCLRLACDLECLSITQYEHGSRQVVETGRLLGAWLKRLTSG
jgi:hypothetical protein